jgi:GDP-L-fucose synthase
MNKNSKILVLGASGMVGSAIVRKLLALGYNDILGTYNTSPPNNTVFFYAGDQLDTPKGLTLVRLDLTIQEAVNGFLGAEKPDYVFLAAAKVGGIHANNTYSAQFIYDNLAIQCNVIHAAYECSAARLLFLGSSCIYPRMASQPMREEQLLTGPLEPTNEPYAIAKIAGIKMCEAYNRQYGTRFMALMPTNLYGPNDNFDPQDSHVLPALIHKFHKAKVAGKKEIMVWGSGTPRREFLHVDDMADACVYVMNLEDKIASSQFFDFPVPCFLNVGVGIDCTIRELTNKIKKATGFKGGVLFDTSKPDGAPRKLLDNTKLSQLGWKYKIGLKEGIESTYDWYLRQANP